MAASNSGLDSTGVSANMDASRTGEPWCWLVPAQEWSTMPCAPLTGFAAVVTSGRASQKFDADVAKYLRRANDKPGCMRHVLSVGVADTRISRQHCTFFPNPLRVHDGGILHAERVEAPDEELGVDPLSDDDDSNDDDENGGNEGRACGGADTATTSKIETAATSKSQNGTWVNGERLAMGHSKVLKDGDIVSVLHSVTPFADLSWVVKVGAAPGQYTVKTVDLSSAASRPTTPDCVLPGAAVEDGDLSCPVCKQCMTAAVSVLPCGHTFDPGCLSRHLGSLMNTASKAGCPFGCQGCTTIVQNPHMRSLAAHAIEKDATEARADPDPFGEMSAEAPLHDHNLPAKLVDMTPELLITRLKDALKLEDVEAQAAASGSVTWALSQIAGMLILGAEEFSKLQELDALHVTADILRRYRSGYPRIAAHACSVIGRISGDTALEAIRAEKLVTIAVQTLDEYAPKGDIVTAPDSSVVDAVHNGAVALWALIHDRPAEDRQAVQTMAKSANAFDVMMRVWNLEQFQRQAQGDDETNWGYFGDPLAHACHGCLSALAKDDAEFKDKLTEQGFVPMLLKLVETRGQGDGVLNQLLRENMRALQQVHEHDGINRICSIMNKEPVNADIDVDIYCAVFSLLNVILRFANASASLTRALQKAVVESVAISIACDLIMLGPSDAELRTHACYTIWFAVEDSAALQAAVALPSAREDRVSLYPPLAAISYLLEEQDGPAAGEHGVLTAALGALMALTKSCQKVRNHVAHFVSPASIVRIMQTNSDAAVQCNGCCAIAALCHECPVAQVRAHKAGAMGSVIGALLRHSTDTDIQTDACDAILALTKYFPQAMASVAKNEQLVRLIHAISVPGSIPSEVYNKDCLNDKPADAMKVADVAMPLLANIKERRLKMDLMPVDVLVTHTSDRWQESLDGGAIKCCCGRTGCRGDFVACYKFGDAQLDTIKQQMADRVAWGRAEGAAPVTEFNWIRDSLQDASASGAGAGAGAGADGAGGAAAASDPATKKRRVGTDADQDDDGADDMSLEALGGDATGQSSENACGQGSTSSSSTTRRQSKRLRK